MQAVLDVLNNLTVSISKIDPTFYVVLVGPLANIAQHFLKKEATFAKEHGVLTAVLLAAFAGAFFGVIHTSTMQGFLTSTALVGSPIYVLANVLFQKVSQKLEADTSAVLTAAPVVVPEPAQI